jgi:hypothetical protein
MFAMQGDSKSCGRRLGGGGVRVEETIWSEDTNRTVFTKALEFLNCGAPHFILTLVWCSLRDVTRLSSCYAKQKCKGTHTPYVTHCDSRCNNIPQVKHADRLRNALVHSAFIVCALCSAVLCAMEKKVCRTSKWGHAVA